MNAVIMLSVLLFIALSNYAVLEADDQRPNAAVKTAEAKSFELTPYDGPSVKGVDASTLTGKVMCGYQGWFNCEGDGANLGWTHWARDRRHLFAPGNVTVDLWPDVSEYGADDLYQTGFKLANGEAAKVFSSADRSTVLRHFEWMRDYGIDGAFVQRFANGLRDPTTRLQKDRVLANAREGANRNGRAYAVMYDLSGLRSGEVSRIRDDWIALQQEMEITKDPAYLHHDGGPVIAVWGVGFSDNRKYSPQECLDLVSWLKSEGCTVMLGVPSWWRERTRDATDDPLLSEIVKQADIISPWTIGRYRTPLEAARHGEQVWKPDLQWCNANSLDFLPVVFPGFSWHNLHGDKLNDIPRLKGEFLWSQIEAAKRIGAEMIYVAMFDEVDEGTAIFKCTDQPPTGDGARFLDNEGLPSDYYLKLVGKAGEILRGQPRD